MNNLHKAIDGEEFMWYPSTEINVCNISTTKEKEKKWTQGVMWGKLGLKFT